MTKKPAQATNHVATFNRLIEAAGSGREVPISALVKGNQDTASIISKLVPGSRGVTYDTHGNVKPIAPDLGSMRRISYGRQQSIKDSKTVMQVLPEMRLVQQILTSSILAPKDMVTSELIYTADQDMTPPEVSSSMTSIVERYFDESYKIKELLPSVLEDVLFTTGSYPVLVLPENTVDAVINGTTFSLESLYQACPGEFTKDRGDFSPKGLLGDPDSDAAEGGSTRKHALSAAMESYGRASGSTSSQLFSGMSEFRGIDTHVTVSDNINLLRQPLIKQRISMEAAGDAMREFGAGKYSRKLTDRNVSAKLYGRRNTSADMMLILPNESDLARKSVGGPLILKVPSEAALPVHVPGAPESHVGYLLLLDQDGNFISGDTQLDCYQQLNSRMGSSQNFATAMIEKVSANFNGFDQRDERHVQYFNNFYASMVERDLLSRLRNGVPGDGLAIARRDEVYRVMLARSLASKHTKILYVTAEMMTYIALDYNDDGTGKSVMEDMKILNSMRMMVTFADVMASVKNSIGVTEVKLKFDENDPDPEKTAEKMMHEIARVRQGTFPIGLVVPSDLLDHMQRASMQFSYEGHPAMPDMTAEFGERSTNFIRPDESLDELLRKKAIMGFGLSPEAVDAGYNAEFATSVTANNLLLSKRVIMTQEKLMPQVTALLRNIVANTPAITDQLEDIVRNNIDAIIARIRKQFKDIPESVLSDHSRVVDEVVTTFISSFRVDLPKPDTANEANQVEAFTKYRDGLKEAIDVYLGDFINEATVGGLSEDLETFRSTMLAHYMRKWMSNNGMFNELGDMTRVGEDQSPDLTVLNENRQHLLTVAKLIGNFVTMNKAIRDAATAVSDAAGDRGDQPDSDSSAGGESSDLGGGSDFELDEGGGEAGEAEAEAGAEEAEAGAEEAAAGAEEARAEAESDEENKPTDEDLGF